MAISEVYQLSIISGLIEQQLDPEHDLLVLARKLDWHAIHKTVKTYFKLRGRNAKDSRLTVGALMLKHKFKLSDESVVAGLQENIYWRSFCGLTGQIKAWHKKPPLNSSTLTKFRRRVGAEGIRSIELVIRNQLVQDGSIDPTSMYIDTTAQEKNIAYPVDTHLLNKAQERIRKGIAKVKRLGLKVSAPNRSRKAKKQVLLAAKLEDKTILCCKCRLPFVFTVSEQGYFELRQLKNEPKRCSNCRILRRLEEQGKEIATCLTKVDCHECGDVTLVPFKPSGVKPVYCANCMHARKTETNSTP